MQILLHALLIATVLASPLDVRQNSNATNKVPLANGGQAWQMGFQKAKALVAKLTTEEKSSIVTSQVGRCAGNSAAVERLGLPALCLQDGPAGIRPALGASQWPTEHTTAATWDRTLFYSRSNGMGQEFRDNGVAFALTPVSGGPLGRSPLEGRQFEAPGPDPYLTGEFGYWSTKGLQDAGIAGCLKHFIAYEQETSRNLYGVGVMVNGTAQLPIDSYVDNQATHELYMWPFAESVRAGIFLTMCSYNEINGTHACSSYDAMTNLLKKELNFQGAILSDWGAVWENLEPMENGLDIVAPGFGYNTSLGTFGGQNWTDYVNNGTVASSRLDDMVIRTLTAYFQLGLDENPLPSIPFNAVGYPDYEIYYRNTQKAASVALIKEIGEQSAILLKNTGSLPLGKPATIAVIGEDAGPNVAGWDVCGAFAQNCPAGNINGTLSGGAGSGWAFPHNLFDPLTAIRNRGAQYGAYVTASLNNTDFDSIAAASMDAEVAIVFASVWTDEGLDRANLNFTDNSLAAIQAATSQNNNTIVVAHVPGPTIIEAFIDNPNVTAVIYALYPGEQTGNAIVSILFGDVNPSGKLPFTLGHSLDEYIPNSIIYELENLAPKVFFNSSPSLQIDYRWFDAQNIEPRFEFGFGLSYTNFTYSNLQVEKTFISDNTSIQKTAEPFFEYSSSTSLYDIIATVSVNVKNIGQVKGSEVAQLYVGFEDYSEQPPKQMRGFDKVKDLEPGATGVAKFELRRKDLSLWNTTAQYWREAQGNVTLYVGASSRSLPLQVSYS